MPTLRCRYLGVLMNSDTIFQVSLSADAEALSLLANKLHEKQVDIEQWFLLQWKKTPPPLYGSVDMRNAGFKVSPVDMNLFPAGFNNLNPFFLKNAVRAAKQTVEYFCPRAKCIAIIPENHTRNLFYWENIYALVSILTSAGFKVSVGSLVAEKVLIIKTPSGNEVVVYPFQRKDNYLEINEVRPDFLLLNNDLSEGIPTILANLKQPIFPSVELGWHQRLKSEHFQYYAAISQELSDILGIDSWLITPFFRHCDEIDFLQREGIDCLIENTQLLLNSIQKKYQEYQISSQPFAIVKADAGTQGMAVLTVRNVDELKILNRKQRTSMAKSKGGISVRRALVQEGVYTFETFGPQVYATEPVIYMLGKQVIGGFYRLHQDRGPDENLNTPGMHFVPLPFAWSCGNWPEKITHPHQKYLYIYGVIARLSMLAAAREMANLAVVG